MTYRAALLDRLYVCPACGAAERAPIQGGDVPCARCRAVTSLPDRTVLPATSAAFELPPTDEARQKHLQAQAGLPRQVSATLQAVLGGTTVRYGREQEAIAIWQSLRARSQQGDVAASEDLSTLTVVMAQLPSLKPEAAFREALHESAYDAVMLPRHKQEQLGPLARMAIATGDRTRGQQYLAWMVPWPLELEAESEMRISAAAFATLDRDGQRVLALLGRQKGETPIAESMGALASVLRANAYELLGDVAAAAHILRELPQPRVLELIAERFPSLQLCAQSGPAYKATSTQEAARRAASGASNIGLLVGGILVFAGLAQLPFAVMLDDGVPTVSLVLGFVLVTVGVVVAAGARATGERAAWLRANGLPLTARILSAQPTGATINDVPVCRFALQVTGPQGPYAASFERPVPAHELALLVGGEVRVRANPGDLQEVICED